MVEGQHTVVGDFDFAGAETGGGAGQRAVADCGAAAVCVGAGQRQIACAKLCEGSGSGDFACVAGIRQLVEGQLTIDGDFDFAGAETGGGAGQRAVADCGAADIDIVACKRQITRTKLCEGPVSGDVA